MSIKFEGKKYSDFVSGMSEATDAQRAAAKAPISVNGSNATVPLAGYEGGRQLSIVSNPEYVYAVVDSNGVFLFGVKADGSVEWQKGVPEPVKTALESVAALVAAEQTRAESAESTEKTRAQAAEVAEETRAKAAEAAEEARAKAAESANASAIENKVDKEENKGLVNTAFGNCLITNSNPEFEYVIIDASERVLFGIRKDGSIDCAGIETIISNYVDSLGALATETYVDDKVNSEVTTEKTRASASEANLQAQINAINPTIVEGGDNNPDEEYTTAIDEKITLKDRIATTSTLGYIHVRNSSDVSSIFSSANTIYEIKGLVDLGSATITIPAYCTLKFVGGKIINGTLNGNNTKIDYVGTIFGSSLTLGGTWDISHIRSDMVENANENLRNLMPLLNASQHQIFEVLASDSSYTWTPTANNMAFITLPSNTELIVDGTLEMGANQYPNYQVVKCLNAVNVKIHGNGAIKGDADSHTYTSGSTHEWGHGLKFTNCYSVEINGVKIANCTGDGVSFTGERAKIENLDISHCGRQGVTVAKSNLVILRNIDISDIYRTAPKAGIDIEPDESSTAAFNIIIENVTAKNCVGYGLQCLKANNVNVKNMIVEGSLMFLCYASENVRFEDVDFKPTTIGSKYLDVTSDCENVFINGLDISYSLPIELNLDNVRLGENINLPANSTFSGSPIAGTTLYNGETFSIWNGSAWIEICQTNA